MPVYLQTNRGSHWQPEECEIRPSTHPCWRLELKHHHLMVPFYVWDLAQCHFQPNCGKVKKQQLTSNKTKKQRQNPHSQERIVIESKIQSAPKIQGAYKPHLVQCCDATLVKPVTMFTCCEPISAVVMLSQCTTHFISRQRLIVSPFRFKNPYLKLQFYGLLPLKSQEESCFIKMLIVSEIYHFYGKLWGYARGSMW